MTVQIIENYPNDDNMDQIKVNYQNYNAKHFYRYNHYMSMLNLISKYYNL